MSKCYFERHAFDLIISSGKLVQKRSSEHFFENIKIESNSRFLKYYIKKRKENIASLKTKSLEQAVLNHLSGSYI